MEEARWLPLGLRANKGDCGVIALGRAKEFSDFSIASS
jgi:hypothetical protein